jgi:hypothetical protein
MAIATTDMRIETPSLGFHTICIDPHLLGEKWEGTFQAGFQHHMRTFIRQQDLRNRAVVAHVAFPAKIGGSKETAFLPRSTTEIISKEISAFLASGSFHRSYR